MTRASSPARLHSAGVSERAAASIANPVPAKTVLPSDCSPRIVARTPDCRSATRCAAIRSHQTSSTQPFADRGRPVRRGGAGPFPAARLAGPGAYCKRFAVSVFLLTSASSSGLRAALAAAERGQQQAPHGERVREAPERARRAAGTRRDRSAACARPAAPRSGARGARRRTGRAASRPRSASAPRARTTRTSQVCAQGDGSWRTRSRTSLPSRSGNVPSTESTRWPGGAMRAALRVSRWNANTSAIGASICSCVRSRGSGPADCVRAPGRADSPRGRLRRTPRRGCARASRARA